MKPALESAPYPPPPQVQRHGLGGNWHQALFPAARPTHSASAGKVRPASCPFPSNGSHEPGHPRRVRARVPQTGGAGKLQCMPRGEDGLCPGLSRRPPSPALVWSQASRSLTLPPPPGSSFLVPSPTRVPVASVPVHLPGRPLEWFEQRSDPFYLHPHTRPLWRPWPPGFFPGLSASTPGLGSGQ